MVTFKSETLGNLNIIFQYLPKVCTLKMLKKYPISLSYCNEMFLFSCINNNTNEIDMQDLAFIQSYGLHLGFSVLLNYVNIQVYATSVFLTLA